MHILRFSHLVLWINVIVCVCIFGFGCSRVEPPVSELHPEFGAPSFVVAEVETFLCECIMRHHSEDLLVTSGRFEDRPQLNVEKVQGWRVHLSTAWATLRTMADRNTSARNMPRLTDRELWEAACLPWGYRWHGWIEIAAGELNLYIQQQQQLFPLSISVIEKRRATCEGVLVH